MAASGPQVSTLFPKHPRKPGGRGVCGEGQVLRARGPWKGPSLVSLPSQLWGQTGSISGSREKPVHLISSFVELGFPECLLCAWSCAG